MLGVRNGPVTMRRILFTNHLAPGAASCYRQSDLAKYLTRRGFRCDFIGRRPKRHPGREPGEDDLGLRNFESATYWKEPLEGRIASNVGLFRRTLDGGMVHVSKAFPYTATVISLGNVPRSRLSVDMEELDGYGGYSSYAGLYGLRGSLLTFFERLFPKRGGVVPAVSHFLMDRMRRLGVPGERLVFVPNGYDEELFNPRVRGDYVRDGYSLGGSEVVIYASTFHRFEEDIHRIALAAFKLVTRELPGAKMLMVGGGNLDVRPLIAAVGLQGSVVRTGRVSREVIPRMIAASDVALHVISGHPFHISTCPMVVPEYMAMGRATVAPRVGELAFGLGGGAGLLVDRPDPRLLADGMLRLLKDDSTREAVGKAALSRAREEYSLSVLAARLGSAYEALGAA